MDIKNLTADERSKLLIELQEETIAEERRKKLEIETYKKIVCDTVNDCFPKLEEISSFLTESKKSIRETFDTILKMKGELYGTKEGQYNHTFTNENGDRRIKIGYYILDNYDDTVNDGISVVRERIFALATTEETKWLIDAILKLLSKDKNGTLKASRVLQLQQIAEKKGDKELLKGVKIIRDAYAPIESKSFIQAQIKNKNGVWVSVPLGLTEA